MAEQSGFFDAHLTGGEYDRVYLASSFARYFASFIGNGVFADKAAGLMAYQTDPTSMRVKVLPGQAWINGYWYENDSEFSLPIDVADGVLNRIDLVTLRWGTAERSINLAVKKGTPAVNAVAPVIQRDSDYYELKLAEIRVTAGTVSITQANIVDTRADTNVCGWVTGVIKQADTSQLFAQWQAAYEAAYSQWQTACEASYSQWQKTYETEHAKAQAYYEEQKAAWERFFASTTEDSVFPVPSLEDVGKIPMINATADGYELKPITGKITPQGGEIFNDYENNKALAPYAKADGIDCRAGIYGYKLLAVEKDGESYNITVGDADLESKAIASYAVGDILCFDGTNHYYDVLEIASVTANADGNSVIQVKAVEGKIMPTLAVDKSKDEWENWVYVLAKPDAGEPVKAAFGAYAGGVGSVAIGYGAFAHGENNQSIGKYAFTAGRDNIAHYAGDARGRKNKSLAENSSTEGYNNTVADTATNGRASGSGNTVSGKNAHAQNSNNKAKGSSATVSGSGNEAIGDITDAGGSGTKAVGAYSQTRGYKTETHAPVSDAKGRETRTTEAAYGSSVEGRGTIAASQYQHVRGKYNEPDVKRDAEGNMLDAEGKITTDVLKAEAGNKYADIVGGGTSDTKRKNIYALDWDGNAHFAGKVYSGGVEVALDGLVYASYHIASGSDEELMEIIDSHYKQMADNTVRFIVIGFGTAHPVIGGAAYLVRIYRRADNYGSIECSSYTSLAYRRRFEKFKWCDWEDSFAPAGFGLGKRTNNLPKVTKDTVDKTTVAGWYEYYSDEGVAGRLCVDDYGNGYRGTECGGLLVIPSMWGCNQFFFCRNYYGGYLKRNYIANADDGAGGHWEPWEWENPILALGTEYRTTERYRGAPVYAKHFKVGVSITAYGSATVLGATTQRIPHEISNYSTLVRCLARKNGTLLPWHSTDATVQVSEVSSENIFLTLFTNKSSATFSGTLYITLYYIKE